MKSSESRTPHRLSGTSKQCTSDDLADWYEARLRLQGSRGDRFIVHRIGSATPERPTIRPVPFGRANRQSTLIVPLRTKPDDASAPVLPGPHEPLHSS